MTVGRPGSARGQGHAGAPNEGDAPAVILRAVEEYVTASAKRTGRRPGKYRW